MLSCQFSEDVNVCNFILTVYSANGIVNDAIPCNAMMACYVRNMYVDQALLVFEYKWNQHIELTKRTFTTVLLFLILSKRIFDDIETKEFVLWNVLISAYTQNGLREFTFQSFVQMLEENMLSDKHIFSRVLGLP